MESNLKLSNEQKLQQRLTPMQVRYVRMLEMTGPEFEDEIRKAVDEMPALEADSAEKNDADRGSSMTEDGEQFTESEQDMQLADYRNDDDIPDYMRRQMRRSTQASPEDYYEPTVVAEGDSLTESLMRQLDETVISEEDRMIAEHIIGNLDDNGYLTRHPSAIANDISFSTGKIYPVERIKEVWERVRELDPPGIASSDLRDCLLLQLQRLPHTVETRVALEIVRDYFDLFAKRHYDRIMAALEIDKTALAEAIDVISHLNPKPASLLEGTSGGASRAVIPDFLVESDGNDNLTLSLLNRVPELSVEQTFAEDTPLPGGSKREIAAARTFIKQRRDEATEFIRIVELRQQTLFRVMSAILKFQRQFFLTEDESQIRPMVLRELADATGLDMSVISRATQGKYVMTQRGVYPLKMFFNERRTKNPEVDVETDDNTTPKIMAAIKRIIEEEDKHKPLSDELITRQLTEEGFDIARRTVAKYREKMGFPVGRLRKELGIRK